MGLLGSFGPNGGTTSMFGNPGVSLSTGGGSQLNATAMNPNGRLSPEMRQRMISAGFNANILTDENWANMSPGQKDNLMKGADPEGWYTGHGYTKVTTGPNAGSWTNPNIAANTPTIQTSGPTTPPPTNNTTNLNPAPTPTVNTNPTNNPLQPNTSMSLTNGSQMHQRTARRNPFSTRRFGL